MKVFSICYYAPPQLTPQAIQIGRQLYHLDAGVTLLHGRDGQFGAGYDQYPDFFQRIRPLEVVNPGPRLGGLALRAVRRAVPLYGNCPDNLGRWRARARTVALAHLKAERPDVLVSFGMPMSDHLLGYDLQRATGLPWLVHFSDPWTDNPFHDHGPLLRAINVAMEKRVIGAADQVLFTSERTRAMVMRKYPDAWRDKTAVLPHAWDMEHFAGAAPADAAPPPGVRHVVRHIGACYGARSPVPLFEALARLAGTDPAALDGVLFEFVGYVSPAALESPAFRALPPGLVTLRGQVGYRESLALARSASALLVIDAPSAIPSVFLPSKLVEYIGARRPVWGITPPGTSADLIAEWAYNRPAHAAPGDIDGIVRMLQLGLGQLDRDAAAAPYGPDELAQRFAPARVSGALRAHLQDAITRHGGAPARAAVLARQP